LGAGRKRGAFLQVILVVVVDVEPPVIGSALDEANAVVGRASG